MASTNYILECENFSLEFATNEGNYVRVADNVSFGINKGEGVGIVGESGSGKTVTALSILGLISSKISRMPSGKIWFNHPLKGKINLLELPVKDIRAIRGRHIGMVFQEPMTSLNPVKRCGWQVAEVLLWHKVAKNNEVKKRVLKLFDEVLLPTPERIYKAYPHELSGGQRQRVMIAMAIACNPLLLIADEPTTALDVTVQKSILDLLNELQNRHKMSILFISHDLGVVGKIADDIAVMYRGKVVETGSKNTIFNNPAHPYTKGLINCSPPLDNRPARLPVIDHNNLYNIEKIVIKQIDKKNREAYHKKIYQQKPLLEIQNLSTNFTTKKSILGYTLETHKAVNNVSFDIYPGETVGLVGESGCGKTTLGRSILKLIDFSSGKVLFNGQDLSSLSFKQMRLLRKDIQIIFQDPYSSLTPGISAGSAIMEVMRVHKIYKNDAVRRQKTFKLLKDVNLDVNTFYKYPHQLSGGQRQRVCIARALALEPKLIICDESVSALDVSVQAQILNLLNDLKQKFNLTYLFISHDLSVVKYMSDRIMVMYNGTIVERGEADKLFDMPKSSYTKNLIEAIIS